jgi:hypothetical protein
MSEQVNKIDADDQERLRLHAEEGSYLGDGVYATFDGFQVWLRTERADGGQHVIALEPQVLKQLLRYVRLFYTDFGKDTR